MSDVTIDVIVTQGGTIDADLSSTTTIETIVEQGGTLAAEVIGGGTGETGPTGPQGACGVSGVTGVPGATGATGATGACGVSGVSGTTGACGVSGVSGAASTVSGPAGACGVSGVSGVSGVKGDTGACGVSGVSGVSGVAGTNGACGVSGTAGTNGACGVSGVAGACGVSGVSGVAGACGVSGVSGVAGTPGGAASWLGPWVTSTLYHVNDIVSDGGSSWICILQHTSGATTEPGVGINYTNDWLLVAQKGACGVSGVAGACGVSGTAGTNGACGVSGVAGACGVSGVSGVAGACGISGVAGACGVSGVSGVSGVIGATGPTGPLGLLSDTFMGKVFDTQVTQRDTTLLASTNYLVEDVLENSASFVLELPATSTLEVVPTVKQAEVQSYFGLYDFIESGCVWSADAPASTLLATMSDGYVWINGRRLRVNAVRSRAFTASKDTYVYFSDNGDGTAKLTYVENTNNLSTGSPALAAGSLLNAIIVSGATNIAASTSINQGQETMIVPIVSSIPYAFTDSWGNLICPRDPNRKILGYKQITVSATTTSTTAALIAGLTCPVIVPTGRKAKVTVGSFALTNTGANVTNLNICLTTAADANRLAQFTNPATIAGSGGLAIALHTPSTPSVSYLGTASVTAGTGTVSAATVAPAYILVELV